jgi:hypothetical protein
MTLTLNPAKAETETQTETEATNQDAPAPAPELEPAEDDGRIAVVARLQPRHYEYLAERAAAHGETPERHLETILRTFRSHHDTARPTGGSSQRRA